MSTKITIFQQSDRSNYVELILQSAEMTKLSEKSSYFKSLLDNLDTSRVIEIEEDEIFNALKFIAEIVSPPNETSLTEKWNSYFAKLSTKWLIESYIDIYRLKIKTLMDEVCSKTTYYRIKHTDTIALFWEMLPIVFQYDAYKTDMPIVTNNDFISFLLKCNPSRQKQFLDRQEISKFLSKDEIISILYDIIDIYYED